MLKSPIAQKSARIVMAALIVWGLFPFALTGFRQEAHAGSYNSVAGVAEGNVVTLDVSVGDVKNLWYDEANFLVTYEDGSTGTLLLKSAIANNDAHVEYNWSQISGSSVELLNVGDDSYSAKVTIPLSVFGGKAFTLTSGDTRITSAQLSANSGSSSGSSNDSNNNSSGGTSDSSHSSSSASSSDNGDSGIDIGTLTPSASGKITVDGENGDWANLDALPSSNSNVTEWKLARDTAGNVYVMFDGIASTEWDYQFEWYNFEITQAGQTSAIPVVWLADQTGATVQYKNNAHHNTAASYVVEAMIPAGYFADKNATIKFVDKQVAIDDIPVIDGNDTTPDTPKVYEGIVIDGSYQDWAPVTKYDAHDENGELEQVALVWDGDTVYIYLKETAGTLGAYHAGTHANGKYEIITDLDQRLVFDLNYDGTVSGIEGVSSKHVGDQWEIAIPASNLPHYLKTISFGLYQSDSIISDVVNLNGSGSGGSFTGIVYDGLYGDWDYYPHHIIEYATAGTQENVEDASGALYLEDSTLYGHVYTTMQQHLDNANGHEFTTGVTVRFNDNTSMNFYPRLTEVDDNGNVIWSPQLEGLPNGTYEFSIMSLDAWGSSPRIDDLNEHDIEFGKMFVTIADDKDQCEFYLDLEKVAEKLGVDESDFKVISAQFVNIGNEWITTAGTSTMPFVGIGLGVCTVACVLGWRKLHGKRDFLSSDETLS